MGTWLAVFPFAVVALWHEAHVPVCTAAWLNVAGVHATVRWQVSQVCVVAMWLAGFPLLVTPLWHVAQLPGATP